MDACSMFRFLGAGRGSYTTHEFISKLLGSGTIDKRSEDENRGQNKSSGLRYDRAGRELITPAEVARMPRNKCIILLEAQAPLMDTKYRPFKEKVFLYAKSLGAYERPEKKKSTGSSMEVLTEKGVEHYRKMAVEGETVKIFRMEEEEFLEQDFSQKEDGYVDFAEIQEIMSRRRIQEAVQETKKKIPEELKEKSILEWIRAYSLTDEQIEEIIKGMEEGLNKEQIQEYFFLPAEEMSRVRRIMVAEKRNEET